MIIKTILLPIDKASVIQQRHAEFECTLSELAVASDNKAKVTVSGPDDKMAQLFELIGESIYGSKKDYTSSSLSPGGI